MCAVISGLHGGNSLSRSLRNDNKIPQQEYLHFQNLVVMAFHTKNSVLDNSPLCPQCPLKNAQLYFYCRLAVSDNRNRKKKRRFVALSF